MGCSPTADCTIYSVTNKHKITQWVATTVVPFQCLFIIRQDTAELFESCHRGIRQVVGLPWQWSCIKWTPLLLSVLWVGRCQVAQKSTGWIRAQRKKSKKGVSSMLQVVQWAFSISLLRQRFIQAWRRRQPELYTWTKEAGAEIRDADLLFEDGREVRDWCYLTSKQSRYSWARS